MFQPKGGPYNSAPQPPARLAALDAPSPLDAPAEGSFDRLTRLAADVLGASAAFVSVAAPAGRSPRGASGLAERWGGVPESPLSHGVARHVLAARTSLVVADGRLHPVLRDDPAVRDGSVVACLGVPLFGPGDEVLGAFCVVDPAPREWSAHDVGVVETLAACAATELALRHVTQEAQRQTAAADAARANAEASAWRAGFLAEAGHVLASSLDYAATLRSVAALTVPALGDWCAVDVVDDAGELRREVAYADPTLGPDVRLPEWQEEVDESDAAAAGGATMRVPMRLAARTLGYITFGTARSRRRYARSDRHVAERLAERVALAVESARLYRTAASELAERCRAEERLARNEALLEESQRLARVGSWEWDIETGEVTWSDELYRIYGYEPGGLAVSVDEFLARVHPEDRDRVWQTIEHARASVTPYAFDQRIVRPDGSVRALHCRGRVVAAEGRAVRVLGSAQDVTVQRELEAQLRQSQKMEAVGQLAGGVAHDFNNLLTVVRAHSDFLLEALPPGTEPHNDVVAIRQASDRAAGLTRQLLAFSRKQLLKPRVLDVNETAFNLVPMLRRLIGEDIQVVTALDPAVGTVLADPGQLEQVLINLSVNARDAMPDGGTLTITTTVGELDRALAAQHPGAQAGPHVILSVCDTGTGMDAATLARAFEPFFTTKEPGKGTGLGLATVYGIVQQSGGYVGITSAPGAGTTVTIYLPRSSHDAAPAAPDDRTAAPRRACDTVLLVEDEPAVRALVRRILEAKGCTVLEAGDGASALLLARTHDGVIDVVLTDLVMPGMSGRAFAERLTVERPETKVLFMTGYTDDDILRRGLLDHEAVILEKPFTAEELVRALGSVVEGREGTPGVAGAA